MGFSIVVRTNRINQVQARITDNAVNVVREQSRFMRDYAAGIAPRDTGSFASSLYVNGPGTETDYPSRAQAAADANPRAVIIDQITAAQADTSIGGQLRNALGQFSLPEAIVASAVEHSVFLENGTRYMAPQPTLGPAAAATLSRFESAMRDIADGV